MKYIIGYLAVFFTFFACSNDSISVNEVPIGIIEKNSIIPLLEYKFDDINGFELGSDFEELYVKKQIDYGDNCTLSLDNGNLKLRYTESTPVEISTKAENMYANIINETVKEDVLGTLGVKIQTVDKKSVYIGGIKNNKLWFGLFDNKTKEKIKEWKDNNEFERIVSTNNGYGNYVDVNIDYLQQTDNIQTENGLCVLLYPQNHKAIFINDNKISSAALIPRNKVSLKTWYNKSILIQSEEEYCENDYFVYSDEGELITSFHNIDVFDEYNTDTWYPCSYTEVIGIGLRACWYDILRVALDSPYVWEEIVWSTQIDLFLSLASSYSVRMTSKLISINDNLWEMEYEAVKFSGDRIKTHFIINVENGNIVYQ